MRGPLGGGLCAAVYSSTTVVRSAHYTFNFMARQDCFVGFDSDTTTHSVKTSNTNMYTLCGNIYCAIDSSRGYERYVGSMDYF